jgi:hypothetical protein
MRCAAGFLFEFKHLAGSLRAGQSATARSAFNMDAISHCPSSVADQNASNRSVDRLAEEYTGALPAHEDVRSLLAIR